MCSRSLNKQCFTKLSLPNYCDPLQCVHIPERRPVEKPYLIFSQPLQTKCQSSVNLQSHHIEYVVITNSSTIVLYNCTSFTLNVVRDFVNKCFLFSSEILF